MKLNELINANEKELPLDNISEGGGYTGIFRSFAIIGDSLSSGEFEGRLSDGTPTFHDLYDYSWGAYVARAASNAVVHNFSRGGMTAREFITSWAYNNDFFNPKYAAQCYIFALGVNDLMCNREPEIGTADDMHVSDPEKNPETFAGFFGKIVSRYQALQKNGKFFFLTMPRDLPCEEPYVKKGDDHAKLMYAAAERFPNSYVIDLRKYGPVYDAAFKEKFYKHGHMNPAGYLLTGRMVTSYIDYIIRHNFKDFISVGTIGTGFETEL